MKAGVKTFYAKTQKEWRKWLEKNHRSEKAVWLIFYKKGSGIPSTNYAEALEEALCFGWIDSKANKRDDKSYYQYFANRKPESNWSKVNKEKVAKLIENNKTASDYWEKFSRFAKRAILEWILNAKRPETRQKRINETAELAGKNIKANQHFRPV